MWWIAAMGWALAGPPRLDVSSLVPSTSPVASRVDGVCAGRPDDVYAVAVVIYGRQKGRSTWGHISLRFLACQSGRFRDVEFEATRVDDTLVDWYASVFPNEEWFYAPDFLELQHDRLVLFRNRSPVDTGLYRDELDKNREVTELWMPWSGAEALAMLQELDADYAAQLAELRRGERVDRPDYKPFSTNCTLPIRRMATAMSWDTVDSVFPMVWLRQLEDHPDVAVVVHPSSHVLAQIQHETGDLKAAWSGAPTRVFRPLVRRELKASTFEAYRARVSMTAEPLAVEWVLEGL